MDKPTKEQFDRDVANHQMTILHEFGVYRHITFGRPDSGIDRFNLTTVPGRLMFTGDRGDYVFERTDDMFGFFRRGDGEINPGYWAEKCVVACRDGIKQFSADVFCEEIRDHLECIEASYELRQRVEDLLLSCTDELSDESAHAAVADFEDDDGTLVFCDSYEFDFTAHTYRFIWCLRAIVFGIAMYDASRVATDGGTQ